MIQHLLSRLKHLIRRTMGECENPSDAKQISRVKTNAVHRKIHTVPYSTPIFDISKFNYIVPSGRINSGRGMEGTRARIHLKYMATVAQTASVLFELHREAGHPA